MNFEKLYNLYIYIYILQKKYRPYYMSRGLMEFVQSSKQFKDIKNSNKVKVMQVERKQQTLPTVTQ